MSSRAAPVPRKRAKLTLDALRDELVELRARVEDLEDLRELNAAILRNKDKKLIPWAAAKQQLDFDQ